MGRPRQTLSGIAMAAAVSAVLVSAPKGAWSKDQTTIPAVRWSEGNPGCTYSRDEDGKYRYGLWSRDTGIIVAIDSQELEKVAHRHEPFFAVLLTIRYRGQSFVEVSTTSISLEFVKHFHIVQPSLDPDAFSEKVQNDADNLNNQTARWLKKHPDRREEREAYVRAFLKDSAELEEFVGKNSLRETRLSPGNNEISGWVLFSTENKWIGGWKKPEEFVLRVPLDGTMFEFPFALPPKRGEVLLRKRN